MCVWVCVVERYMYLYVFMYVWRYAYVTIHATTLKYRFQLWQNFERVALGMKQVRGKWDMMFQLLRIRRKPHSRKWYHVASWTDAKVSKESAVLISHLIQLLIPNRRLQLSIVHLHDATPNKTLISKKNWAKKCLPTKRYGCTGRMAAIIVFFSDTYGC